MCANINRNQSTKYEYNQRGDGHTDCVHRYVALTAGVSDGMQMRFRLCVLTSYVETLMLICIHLSDIQARACVVMP